MQNLNISELKDSCEGGQTEAELGVGREVSPVKEKLLTTFAQLTPSKDIKTDSPDREETSWLSNVKGKFAKTVDNSRERYQELRAERGQGNVSSLDLEEDKAEAEDMEWKMPHSLSENCFNDLSKPKKEARPQSQIFDFVTRYQKILLDTD